MSLVWGICLWKCRESLPVAASGNVGSRWLAAGKKWFHGVSHFSPRHAVAKPMGPIITGIPPPKNTQLFSCLGWAKELVRSVARQHVPASALLLLRYSQGLAIQHGAARVLSTLHLLLDVLGDVCREHFSFAQFHTLCRPCVALLFR